MPVLNDEVPDDDDFDANRHRGEFDDITPEHFMHASAHGNPPGWLSAQDLSTARSLTPIPYVEVVPVRTDGFGRVTHVGTVLRVSEDGSVERTLVTGRVMFHETLREAIARNISKDLGELALPRMPLSLQPFTVAEYLPTRGLTDYFDSRQHAIALCYVIPIAGECNSTDETLDIEWTEPESEATRQILEQMTNGHDNVLRQAIAWCAR